MKVISLQVCRAFSLSFFWGSVCFRPMYQWSFLAVHSWETSSSFSSVWETKRAASHHHVSVGDSWLWRCIGLWWTVGILAEGQCLKELRVPPEWADSFQGRGQEPELWGGWCGNQYCWLSCLASPFLCLCPVKKGYSEKPPELLQFVNQLTLVSLL